MPYLLAALILLALLVTQTLIGGAKLLYSIPGYTLIAVAGLLSVIGFLRRQRSADAVCVMATLCMAGYLVGRAILSPVDYLARPDLYLLLGCLVVYLVTAYSLTGSKQRILVLGGLLVFAFAHIVVGVIQFKEGKQYMPLPWIIRTGYESRASGLYICPNHFAGLLEALGLVAVSLAVWSRSTAMVTILFGYTAAACFLGVAISGSRGGYLSSATGLLVFAATSVVVVRSLVPRHSWKLGPLVVLCTVLFCAGAFFLMKKSDALHARVDSIAETSNIRILLWEAALKQFVQNPLRGTGAGTYLYYGRHFRSAVVQNDPIYVHNDYLHLLAEYGAAGAALMLLFLGTHLAAGWRWLGWCLKERLRSAGLVSSNSLALQVGAISVVAAYLVHSVLDFNAHIPANALLLAFLFGMLANPGMDGAPVRWPGMARLGGILAPAIGLWILLGATPKLFGEYYSERARIGLRDNVPTEALQFATIGLGFEQANPDLYYYLGESHRLLMDDAQSADEKEFHGTAALEAFKMGLKAFPWDLRSLLKCGRTLDELRRFPEARGYFLRALDADPNFTNVYAYYGLHFHRQGHLDQAEIHYRKALKLGENQVAKIGLEEIARARKRYGLPELPKQ